MSAYQNVTSDGRAVPQILSKQGRQIRELEASTSGQQWNSLATAARMDSVHVENSGVSTPAGGGTVLSASVVVPARKTTCHALVSMNGFYIPSTSDPRAYWLVFQIRIQGVLSPRLPRIPDNMDTFHLVGSFSRQFSVTPGDTVTIELVATGSSQYPSFGTDERSAIDAFLAFT